MAKRKAERAALDKLFRPRSVAVIGASRRRDSLGRVVLANLVEGGFEGKVFPVNPNVEVLHSIKCHPSVEAIEDPIDLAVIAIPKERVQAVVEQCARKGVGAIVVITAGYRETGEQGVKREERLVAVARANGMRLVGPNCMGIQNAEADVRMNASFSRSFPRARPNASVAFVSQSGAMGEAILAHADRLNLGISRFVSMGNRADVSANDLLEHWGDDPSIRLVLLYLESFGNPRHFVPIARRVSRSKAIVTVKAGRSQAGAIAATSHTGSLAGADVAVDAVLADCGVQRVGSVEELFDVALALAQLPLPKGPRAAVLTNAGGPGILATDALVASGLEMAPLEPSTRDELRAILVPEASVQNPIDMVASATAEQYERSLRLLLADPTVDMALVIFVPVVTHDPVDLARRVFEVARGAEKPVVGCFMSRDEILRTIAAEATQDWVPVYLYPESAVRALAALVERRRILERPIGTVRRFRVGLAAAERALASRSAGGWLGVEARRALCKAYGLPLAPGGLARTASQAVAIAERLGYPVVLKTADPSQVHKSDVGGVLLDVADQAEVERGFRRLAQRWKGGVDVSKMMPPGTEVVVGVTCDPAFGPLLMFGLGGIFVEVLEDVAFAACPVSDVRARELLRSIRGYPILHGIRGQQGVDEEALITLIQRVSQLALAHPEIRELEINPLLAYPDGLVAVDSRVRVERKGRGAGPRARRAAAGARRRSPAP